MTLRPRRALGVLAATLVLTGGGFAAVRQAGTDQREPQWSEAAGTPSEATTPSGAATPAATAAPSGVAPSAQAASKPQPTPTASRTRAIGDATAQIRRNGPAVKSAPDEKYQAVDAVVDTGGARHVRFQRTHRGLAVLGGDFVVHTAANGRFTGATVAQATPIDVPAAATIDRKRAVAVAEQRFTGRRTTTTARQVVDAFAGAPVLAWEVTITGQGASGVPSVLVVVVDATTGTVRRSYDEVHTADDGTGRGLLVGDVPLGTTKKDDGTYLLVDPARGGTTVRDAQNRYLTPTLATSLEFTDADDVWGNGTRSDRATAAVDVHYGLARTWDYLRDTFGRSGIGNDGKGMTAYVHYFTDYENAAYSSACKCMWFGDGEPGSKPFTSLDVVAHEAAHGLNDATADLVGDGESGGLNEANSDILGTLVEFAVNSPVDKPDYLVGEMFRTPFLRRMDEPSADGKSLSCWTPTAKDLDEHYSSGIGNKFFYNLAVGSGTSAWGTSTPCGDAAPVTGIGNDKAAKIWYRAMTVYMVSNTNFAGARQATLLAAADLHGPDSPEARAVDAAWLAVGVDASQVAYGTPAMVPFKDNMPAPRIGEQVNLQVSAKDPQGQALTFTATNLPPGVSIDPSSGLISGQPTTRGDFRGDIIVTDPDGNSAQQMLWWVVKGPPVIRSLTPTAFNAQLGVGGSGLIRATVDDFSDHLQMRSRPVAVTATGLPDGFSLSVGKPKGSVYDVIIAGLLKTAGSGTAMITATDSDGEQVTASVPWTVTPAKAPGQPEGVAVSSGNGTALVQWNRPTLIKGQAYPTGYVVRVTPGAQTRLDLSALSLRLTGLDVRRAYTIGVRSVSAAGDSPEKTVTLTPTSLPVAPASAVLDHGKGLTLTGRVVRGGGGAVAGAVAVLEQRPSGRTTWSRVTTLRTDAKGGWRYPVVPATNAAYRVTYAGSPGMWPATSAVVGISVRHAVSVKAGNVKPKVKQKVKISGVVKPARAGVTVTLQRLVGSRWGTVTSVRTGAKGAYSFSRAFPRGNVSLRVVVAGGAYNAGVVSTVVKLKVK